MKVMAGLFHNTSDSASLQWTPKGGINWIFNDAWVLKVGIVCCRNQYNYATHFNSPDKEIF